MVWTYEVPVDYQDSSFDSLSVSFRGPASSVCIATGYGLDGPGI
jgi:hypothetical protein